MRPSCSSAGAADENGTRLSRSRIGDVRLSCRCRRGELASRDVRVDLDALALALSPSPARGHEPNRRLSRRSAGVVRAGGRSRRVRRGGVVSPATMMYIIEKHNHTLIESVRTGADNRRWTCPFDL